MTLPEQTNSRRLIAYPFPLGEGLTARLELPADGLLPDEAKRLKDWIEALVILDIHELT